ncbi:serine hydrolase [Sporosarcina sp. NCCP-2716]|uniref:serine hydrolase n=1 Tax=Sporosarcina sp. NCCP-2716 TaxID=2943679 RepID=UPI00203F5153|nr:serine hydrolase [Sporosarcina sp. NCCP-2716]GKV70469.1 serine hydrolase [Sporosarcina sp. NCCP-2716]
MDFAQLEQQLQILAAEVAGTVSMYVRTPDGTVAIGAEDVIRSASILKVPIAMACLAAADRGELDLNTLLPISEPVGGSGVLAYLSGMEQITLLNALTLSIIVSDNTAANLVIEATGLNRIQAFFDEVGAKNSKVTRKFMDYDALALGLENVATARDMAMFLECLHPDSEFLSLTSKQQLKTIMRDQQLIDKLPAFQPIFDETLIIGNKTGTLPGVEHDIAYFENDVMLVDLAVLTTDWDHNHEGQQTLARIGRMIIDYMASASLKLADDNAPAIACQ